MDNIYKYEGVCKYIWTNVEIYEGEWVNGTKHGNGVWVGIKEDKYVGEWYHYSILKTY